MVTQRWPTVTLRWPTVACSECSDPTVTLRWPILTLHISCYLNQPHQTRILPLLMLIETFGICWWLLVATKLIVIFRYRLEFTVKWLDFKFFFWLSLTIFYFTYSLEIVMADNVWWISIEFLFMSKPNIRWNEIQENSLTGLKCQQELLVNSCGEFLNRF